MASKIEWTDETWSPITGCSAVSEACQKCYAARLASTRLKNHPHYSFLTRNGKWTGQLQFNPNALGKPLHWRKPRKIFVCSMSDFFHEQIDYQEQVAVFEIIKECFYRGLNHTFIFLTKRPQNMSHFFECNSVFWHSTKDKIIENLWLGVTAENQARAEERIPELLKLRPYASKLFVSVEPMLEAVDFIGVDHVDDKRIAYFPDLDWVICGPENGPGKREFKEEWAIDLQRQCEAAGVAFFFKGGKLDGKRYEEFPE